MTERYVWPAVVLACVAIAAAAAMAILHVSQELIVSITSVLVTPVLGALIVSQVGGLRAQQAATAATTDQVASQTNGNLSRLLDLVEGNTRMLAAANVPTAALEPAPAEPPGTVGPTA